MFLMSMFLCHLPMEGFLCSQRSTSWSWSSETFPAKGWALSQQSPRNGYPFLKHGLDGCLVRRWLNGGGSAKPEPNSDVWDNSSTNLQADFIHRFFVLFLRLLSRGYDVSAIGLGGRVGNSTLKMWSLFEPWDIIGPWSRRHLEKIMLLDE